MRAAVTLLSIFFYALSSGTSSRDDRRWLTSLVDLVELDYVDYCEQRAKATWDELVGSEKGLSRKLERDKAFGIFARRQRDDVKSALSAHALGSDDDVLSRKVKLLLLPGDTLLETEQWIRLVTFADTNMNKIRFSTNYDCGTNRSCSLRELNKIMATQQDEDTLLRLKRSWEENLPSLNNYLEQILPLLENSSKANNYTSVEQYWDALTEYEGAILKARELWDNIKPLYMKLQKYVALKLKGSDAVDKPLPVHLLRSLNGDDWSNVLESLLPKHSDIYSKIHANLQLKNLGGLRAYQEAEKLIDELALSNTDPQNWDDSIFNSSCPAVLVDWCKPNMIKAVTCKDISINNYLDAHATVMKVKYKQITALHSNNSYILRDAPRFSALHEAVPGFSSLLAFTPHALDRAGLYPLERFQYNPNHHRLVLQLILALSDLPKLNYYLAVDEWRLQILSGKISKSDAPNSWSDFRRNFSMLETSNTDLLGDPYVLFNKPYIGKFMGLILKYQIYQSFAEEMISDESNLIEHIALNNNRLMDSMIPGYGVIWPELVSEILAKREYGLEYTALTDYYLLLDKYLDTQLEPDTDNEFDDYVEPVEEETLDNEIPSSVEDNDNKEQKEETHENIIVNMVDTGDDLNGKFGTETSTVGVLEIKNPVGAGDQKDTVNTKDASYNTYWWIGIAVAVVVVVVLIAIIARKRHSHRKQLERQRRDTTRA